MRIVVYTPGDEASAWCTELLRRLPGAEVWVFDPADAHRQADFAVVWAPPADMFAAPAPFKAIFTMGAGVDRLLRTPDLLALTRGAPIIRLNDAGMSAQMAEYVCHALVRHTRQLAAYEAQQAAGQWHKWPGISREEWPVGVMGLGSIGEPVARAVAALGYPTLGWSRSARKVEGIETLHGAAALDGFLRRVRVLVCVLPLTPETDGLLNRERLSQLKSGGYLINVARGQHVVDEDLIALIDAGHLAGATLDVFREEPLPAAHPFWRHPKIAVTPHISAITLLAESAAQIAGKIRQLEAGEPLARIDGVVDAARGY